MPIIHHTTKIWNLDKTNIYGDCQIGMYCNIGSFVEIGPGVVIGNNVSIAAFCFIPSGVTIEDGCFIGPRVTFCNDKYPPGGKENWRPILVKKNVSIGAGAIILPGVMIGEKVMVGAGTVVSSDIPAEWRVVGNPARRIIPPVVLCQNGELKEKDDILKRYKRWYIDNNVASLLVANGNSLDDLRKALYWIEDQARASLWSISDLLEHMRRKMTSGISLKEDIK